MLSLKRLDGGSLLTPFNPPSGPSKGQVCLKPKTYQFLSVTSAPITTRSYVLRINLVKLSREKGVSILKSVYLLTPNTDINLLVMIMVRYLLNIRNRQPVTLPRRGLTSTRIAELVKRVAQTIR